MSKYLVSTYVSGTILSNLYELNAFNSPNNLKK